MHEWYRFLQAIPNKTLRRTPEDFGRYLNQVLPAGMGFYLNCKVHRGGETLATVPS